MNRVQSKFIQIYFEVRHQLLRFYFFTFFLLTSMVFTGFFMQSGGFLQSVVLQSIISIQFVYGHLMRQADAQQSTLKLDYHQLAHRKQYGNLIVFAHKYIHLSIGPHYNGFASGFIFLLLYQFGLMSLVFAYIQNHTHIKIGVFLCIYTPTLYLLTSLSNPGIYNPKQYTSPKTKYCHQCQHFYPLKVVKHCPYCDICIFGYDHHCRWISKCIGNGNLGLFWGFMGGLVCLNFFMYWTFYSIYSV